MHERNVIKVIDWIQKHIESSWRWSDKCEPPPAMVLSIEQEIDEQDTHAAAHENDIDKDESEEPKHVVILIVPKGREQKVKLDKNSTKRK